MLKNLKQWTIKIRLFERLASAPPNPFPLIGLIYLLSCFTIIFSWLSLLSAQHRTFELFSHFKWQYFIACLIFLLITLYARRWLLAVLLASTLALNSLFVLPWYFPSDELTEFTEKTETTQFKIVQLNLLSSNKEYQRVIELIEKEAPDIFIALEVNKNWQKVLDKLEGQYPEKIIISRNDNFGIALLSRLPMRAIKEKFWGYMQLPSIHASLEKNGHTFDIVATHPLPPMNASFYQYRNHQLEEMTSELQTLNGPLIIAGDFNLTMWSSDYHIFDPLKLHNVRQGFGLLPTWPAKLSSVGIPIDHILFSKEFIVSHAYTGPNVGSDHLPLIATIQLTNDR